jgi:hypothetical protein
LNADQKRSLFKTLKYDPHSDAQWECHLDETRYKIVTCGRRWGKSTFGGNELTAAALDVEKPDAYYWIVGPDYSLGEKEFRVLYNNLVNRLGLGHRIKKSYNVKQGDMSIKMPWGTVIEVKSAERKDRLVGEGLDGVLLAEAARHSKDTWEEFIEPALLDKRGWATFVSTPRGYNWYQGLHMMGELPDFEDYKTWHLPTWTNKAKFPLGLDDPDIQKLKRRLPEVVWLQEYAAEFVAYEGKIYADFNPKIHVKKIEYNPSFKNYLFFDYGFADPFVCLDVMVTPSGEFLLWREYQVSGLTTWEHGHVIRNRQNPNGYHIDGMFGDPRGADEAATLALILGAVLSQDIPWEIGVNAVRQLMKLEPDGSSHFAMDTSCRDSIRQFERLHYQEIRGERNAKNSQHDYDDHGPDAFRYGAGYLMILGSGARLSDVYTPAQHKSEAYAFFTKHDHLRTDELKWV